MGIGGLGALLWLRRRGAHAWARWMRLACVAFGVAHVACLGLGGWFTPGSWLGAMPPITLL